jgi:hypothetical protein
VFRNINMKKVSGTKNSRTHQEPGDVFEYCFLPDDRKKKLNTQVTCLENTDKTKVSALGNTNPGGTLVFTSR